VTLACGFDADVRLRRDGREVNGKSIMGVMMLAAGKGTRLEVVATGPEAGLAVARLEQLVKDRFGESE
jgi:phosphocarrier protein HPr